MAIHAKKERKMRKNKMNKKKVIVFAKNKYGLNAVLKFLRKNFDHVDVFKGKRGDSFPGQAYNRKYDICVSYMSPWVIPADLLSTIREFSINFHPGTPEYRGIGCTNFAIYNNEPKYGVTAHLMMPKIDSGRIVHVKYFEILREYTLVDITQKCYEYILKQFCEVFNYYLKNGALPYAGVEWSKHLYTRTELDRLCQIKKTMSPEEVKRRIKATNFPNMPKAYIKMFGYRFEYKE